MTRAISAALAVEQEDVSFAVHALAVHQFHWFWEGYTMMMLNWILMVTMMTMILPMLVRSVQIVLQASWRAFPAQFFALLMNAAHQEEEEPHLFG
jgi:hypothetical protein